MGAFWSLVSKNQQQSSWTFSSLNKKPQDNKKFNLFDLSWVTKNPVYKWVTWTIWSVLWWADEASTALLNLTQQWVYSWLNKLLWTNVKPRAVETTPEFFERVKSKWLLSASQKQMPSATSNVLKATKWLSQAWLTAVTPVASTVLNTIWSTETWWKILWTVWEVIKAPVKYWVSKISWLTKEQQSDLTDTLLNTVLLKSSLKKWWIVSWTEKTLKTQPWTTIKWLWEWLLYRVLPSTEKVADLMQKYRAWQWKKPITVWETAWKFNIAWWKENIWAKSRVASENLWNKEIQPTIDKTYSTVSWNNLISWLKKFVSEKITEPWDLQIFKKELWKIEKNYSWKNFTANELRNIKSELAAKTQNITPTSAAKKILMEQLSSLSRKELIDVVKKDTWKDITNNMLHYWNLQELVNMWSKAEWWLWIWARISAWTWWFSWRLIEWLSSAIVPIWTKAWLFLYRLWNWIEFLWPKWIKTAVDLFKNKDKIQIDTKTLMSKELPISNKPLKKIEKSSITPTSPWMLVSPKNKLPAPLKKTK